MRYAQGSYPFCPDGETVVAFVDFIHLHCSMISREATGACAPQVHALLMDSARRHIARTGSAQGIFRPDPQSSCSQSAKHYFSGFTIISISEHTFTYSTDALEVLHAQDYQGHIHWHDGHGRFTIDACSAATSYGSNHPRFSADFAYHSLPFIMAPVSQAWYSTHGKVETPIPESPLPRAPKHALVVPESLTIPSTTPPSSSSPAPHSQHAKLPSKDYFNFVGYGLASPTPSLHGYFDGSPYMTPPTARMVDFGASPLSPALRAHSSTFGLSLGLVA